jgi:hypothetical protein
MTLTHLLEINSKLIKPNEFSSVGLAERIWRNHGCPSGVRELIDLLEKALTECQQCGIRYAPILLQRKKALHRGTWAPQAYLAVVGGGAKKGSSDNGTCSKCDGSGYMPVKGGRSMELCPCEGWKKRSKAN